MDAGMDAGMTEKVAEIGGSAMDVSADGDDELSSPAGTSPPCESPVTLGMARGFARCEL